MYLTQEERDLVRILRERDKTSKPCRFPGCTEIAWRRGLCQRHYSQHVEGQELRLKKILRVMGDA